MRSRHSNYRSEVAELNITAFLNLMVILVPFLLITAVFSRMTVLELMLPEADAVDEEGEEITLSLELVVRQDYFDIRDQNLGLIKRIEAKEVSDVWKVFSHTLLEIKSRFPDEQDITLLLEPEISYQTMIRVMDHVRSIDIAEVGDVVTYELFPNISIGDAPEAESELVENESGQGAHI